MDNELKMELENAMEPTLKKDVELVKQELKNLSNGKEYDTFDTIEEDLIDLLCKENELNPPKLFKDAMTTPFAIAKFIQLKAQDEEMCEEVNKDLNLLFDHSKVTWILHKDLSNEITFSKPLREDTILQKLLVKYRKDPLTDTIIYSLIGNWDISKQNLKALVECNTISTNSISTNLKPTIKTLSDEEFVFEIGNKFTITCKQS